MVSMFYVSGPVRLMSTSDLPTRTCQSLGKRFSKQVSEVSTLRAQLVTNHAESIEFNRIQPMQLGHMRLDLHLHQ